MSDREFYTEKKNLNPEDVYCVPVCAGQTLKIAEELNFEIVADEISDCVFSIHEQSKKAFRRGTLIALATEKTKVTVEEFVRIVKM